MHLIPFGEMVGRLPNFMKTQKRFLKPIVLSALLMSAFFISPVFAQDQVSSLPSTGEEKLHALSLTRFHFITLKQFHSDLYSKMEKTGKISDSEAGLLNAGLNSFLGAPEREAMLLQALRENKAVRIELSIPEEDSVPKVVNSPTKPLLYRLKPAFHTVPVLVAIKPLLDGPNAFEITLEKGNETSRVEVDWAGGIAGLA